jgi:hypothetical protein
MRFVYANALTNQPTLKFAVFHLSLLAVDGVNDKTILSYYQYIFRFSGCLWVAFLLSVKHE